MLRTAIDLKKAIDSIPSKTKSIGTCPVIENNWEEDYDEDDTNSNTNPNSKIWRLVDQIWSISKNSICSYSYGQINSYEKERYFTVNMGSEPVKMYFKDTIFNIQLLMSMAEPSPYGDLKTMTNVVNPEVRVASEINDDKFTVSESLIKELESNWSTNLYPTNVKVVPYKINFYTKGGIFKSHRDTPELGLIGTMIISLTEFKGGLLSVWTDNGEKIWYGKNYTWCGFYPDCVHEVHEIKKGIRTTITFKVFAKSNKDCNIYTKIEKTSNMIISILKEISPLCEDKIFGLILSHEYNIDSNILKGADQVYYRAIQKMGWSVFILPILVYLDGEYGEDESTITCKVYPLLESNIDFVLGKTKYPITSYDNKDIPFFHLDGKGLVWSSHETPYCQYTGNECQPGEENSIYINKALIIDINNKSIQNQMITQN